MTGAPMTRTLPRARQLGSQRTDSPREVVNDASSELSLRAERRLPGDQAALAPRITLTSLPRWRSSTSKKDRRPWTRATWPL